MICRVFEGRFPQSRHMSPQIYMPQPTAPIPLVVDYFVNEQQLPSVDVQSEMQLKYHILPGLHKHDANMLGLVLACVLLDV
jgi:hypothetical protein